MCIHYKSINFCFKFIPLTLCVCNVDKDLISPPFTLYCLEVVMLFQCYYEKIIREKYTILYQNLYSNIAMNLDRHLKRTTIFE